MKLNPKVFRKSARYIWKTRNQKFASPNGRDQFSCITIRFFCGKDKYYVIKYEEVFSNMNQFIPYISLLRFDNSGDKTPENQLQRAIMLDLMAEMIECGDI